MATVKNLCKKETVLFFNLFLFFTFNVLFNSQNIFSQNSYRVTNSAWYWSQPKPTGNLLYSVYFVNHLTGYAAGELGTIIKTTNSGSYWFSQSSNTFQDLSEIYFTNETNGFAVGKAGTILKTSDSGNNWVCLPGVTNNYLHDIQFINESVGYSAGLNGTIVKSNDGGNNWIRLYTDSNAPLFCISFLNEENGVAGGYNAILKTSNGGKSWNIQNVNIVPSCSVTGIIYVDSNTIYAASNSTGGSFHKTTNNGLSWTTTSLGLPYLFDGSVDLVRSLSFVNSNTGFIVTDFGTILKTTNAGNTWQRDSSFRPSYTKLSVMYDINITDSVFINIAGSGGSIYRSTNAGLNWISTAGNKMSLKGSCFINPNLGFTVGEKGTVLKTEDGGLNWISLNKFTTKFLNSVYFIDDKTGFTAGDSGAIYKTTNSGVSWINQTNYLKYNINSIYFIDNEKGIVAGGNPENERAFIFKTDNAGTIWYEVFDSLSMGVLNSIHFINNISGIATGNNGNILRTLDEGESFVPENISSENLYSVSFLDSQNGLISGDNGMMYKTSNSGLDWLAVIAGSFVKLASVNYLKNDLAIAAGDKGTVLISNNGGLNWSAEKKITNNNLSSVQFINGKKLFAFGEYGSIINSNINKSGVTVIDSKPEQGKNFILKQNFPNPFNPKTVIRYSLMENRFTSVKVYDVLGNEIVTLVNSKQDPGNYQIEFNGENLSSGIYYYKISAGEYSEVMKMMLLK